MTDYVLWNYPRPREVLDGRNSLCFECHTDKELAKIDESGREGSLYVDKANWKSSVHARISCMGCHADLEGMEAEHAPRLQRVNCDQCHEDVGKLWSGTSTRACSIPMSTP